MKRRTRRILVSMSLMAGLALVGQTLPARSAPDKVAPSAPASVLVQLAKAERGDIPNFVEAVGTVVPYQSVALKSRIDSQISEVRFHDGDMVKKGDVLFVLDDRALQAQMSQAKVSLLRDQAQLENLRKKFERSKRLLAQGLAVSQQAYEDDKTALDIQGAAVKADQAVMDNLAVQLGYAQIKAPIDGRTGTVNATVGNTVKANDTTALVTINQIHPIWVEASLPQDQFAPLRAAMSKGEVPAVATQKATTINTAGKISYLDNTIDRNSGTFVIRAVFANEDEALWPGMLANLKIRVGVDAGALSIPSAAIQTSPDGSFVYTAREGQAKKTPIKVGRIQGDKAVITAGLEDTDQVVVDGIMALKDGTKIRTGSGPVKPAAPEALDKQNSNKKSN